MCRSDAHARDALNRMLCGTRSREVKLKVCFNKLEKIPLITLYSMLTDIKSAKGYVV